MSKWIEFFGGGKDLTSKRNSKIDSIKFYLIVLVIIGHVCSQSIFVDSTYCRVVWQWIYIFHMPLFIFISGYFTRKKDSKSFAKSSLSILETLIIFQILTLGVEFVHSTISIRRILTPWWVLWYLLSLLYWRTIIQVLPNRILERKRLLVITGFAIGIIVGFLPFTRFLSLQRTFSFLPFFLMGYCWQGKQMNIPKSFRFISILFLLGTLLIPYYIPAILGDLNQADPFGSVRSMCSRILIYCLSIPMSIAFINVCPSNKYTAEQGRKTMQYYIYHALMIWCLICVVNKYTLDINTSFIFSLIYSMMITAIIWCMLKIPFVNKLTNPLSAFRK